MASLYDNYTPTNTSHGYVDGTPLELVKEDVVVQQRDHAIHVIM